MKIFQMVTHLITQDLKIILGNITTGLIKKAMEYWEALKLMTADSSDKSLTCTYMVIFVIGKKEILFVVILKITFPLHFGVDACQIPSNRE